MQLRLRAQQFLLGLLCSYKPVCKHSISDLSTSTAGRLILTTLQIGNCASSLYVEALPIQRGTLGYLAEWDVPGADFVASDLDAEYILTQYAFAPFILARGVNHEWIVGSH